MAQRRTAFEFRTDGSAAYDPSYFAGQESTAQPLPQPRHTPTRRPRPGKKTRVRQKMAVSPFAVLGMTMAIVMLVLVIFGYVQVYEAGSEVDEMQSLVAQLQEDNRNLQNQYDSSINLEDIEARARELGMQQPSAKQIITLNIPAQDTAVIARESTANPIAAAINAIVDTFRSLLEYLH